MKHLLRKILIYFALLLAVSTTHAVEVEEYCHFMVEDGARGVGIQYPVFEELKGEELRALLPALRQLSLADTLQVRVTQGMYRKQDCWELRFYPYIYRDKKYYRLLSFDWKVLRDESELLLQDDYASRANFATSQANFTALRNGNIVNDASRYAPHSVLREGKWQKISVTENGVYRLSYSELKKMGFDAAKVQIYGYGGHLQAENFSDASRPYLDDLPKVAMYKNDAEGYILFYANGLRRWAWDENRQMYVRELNHYSNKAYYFVGELKDGEAPLLMSAAPSAPAANAQTRHYTHFLLHEKDQINLGSTGRECYGESFISATQQTFSFDNDNNLATDQASSLLVEFVARQSFGTSCTVYLNGESAGNINFRSIPAGDNYTYADAKSLRKSFVPKSQDLNISLKYNNGNATPKAAYLDKITLNLRKQLSGDQAVLLFRDPQNTGHDMVLEYQIAQAGAQHIVLDVSQPQQPVIMPTEIKNALLCFRAPANEVREYALVNLNADIPSPKKEDKVSPQDLHSLGAQDFIIIAHQDFLQQAEKLAQAHREMDHLRCVVVNAEHIYNEFSSGTPDATAYRRFVKMLYDRATCPEDIPQSLLLFGDGVYDNRLITNSFSSAYHEPNKLLTYQSKESLEGTSSFVSDDYFALLDDNEGANPAGGKIDIGVGRFPVRNQQEAEVAVEKSINYLKNKDKGNWKNALCFMSDDGDNNTHIGHADALAEIVRLAHPEYTLNKIYVDAFEREISASGTKVPDANRRFDDLLNKGLLLLNYSGHGSTTAWADEGLLSIDIIKNMKNTRLPLWVTATCDFCRYDDSETSGGEMVFLNENGGAMAMVTTSRVVYSAPNFTLNKAFISQVFRKGEDGQRRSLGEIMMLTKQSTSLLGDRNKLNFTLIGDPALKLSYPDYQIQITSIDSIAIDPEAPDTLKALSFVSMQGQILRPDGSPANDFDGVLYPSVFDSEERAYTLGNAGNDVFSYNERNKVLYSGKASVNQGRFDFKFLLPKDLSYSNKNGLVNLYAYSHDGKAEAQGVFSDFLLGGSDSSALKDSLGPDIRLFLNDTLFVDGGKTNAQPTLIAYLHDPNGLNTSGNSIGHDLMLSIDSESKFNLNSYYESDIDSYTSGMVRFRLPELSEGQHHLRLKAWDMQNNSSSQSLSFYVLKHYHPNIADVVLHQSPEEAYFEFGHDRPLVWFTAHLQIFDVHGRCIWQHEQSMMNQGNVSERISWDYRNSGGQLVPDGLYICRLQLITENNEEATISKKIFKLAQ